MSLAIREANISDLDEMTPLLVKDGEQRASANQTLWRMEARAADKVHSTVKAAMENAKPPFRQQWLVAQGAGKTVGVAHTILLPVPPIYAGELGRPGLIMEDCFVSDEAPTGTAQALVQAAEADLIKAGAKILLASSAAGGMWETAYAEHDYEPLTMYFAKVGLRASKMLDGVRSASSHDVTAIVESSAENRQILFDLNAFWKPHADADARFGAWMNKSLTFTDRDMFVSEANGLFTGYAISQPATPLHFPTPHDIARIGAIDDYYHTDLSDPATLQDGEGALSLLCTAGAALEARGNDAALIVCPAAWSSKIAVLKMAGYENAITWFKKRRH